MCVCGITLHYFLDRIFIADIIFEVDTSVTSMTAMLEPLIILVMGAVVGFIVLSVCLPIFEMNQLVR